MKTQIKFFAYWSAFSAVVAGVYWFLSYEAAGTLFLTFMFLAPLMIGAYLALHGSSGLPPQDDPGADHSRVAGSLVGRFSERSVWPLVMAIGLAVGVEGFVYGVWLLVVGLVVFALASIGLMAESRG